MPYRNLPLFRSIGALCQSLKNVSHWITILHSESPSLLYTYTAILALVGILTLTYVYREEDDESSPSRQISALAKNPWSLDQTTFWKNSYVHPPPPTPKPSSAQNSRYLILLYILWHLYIGTNSESPSSCRSARDICCLDMSVLPFPPMKVFLSMNGLTQGVANNLTGSFQREHGYYLESWPSLCPL